MVQVGITPTQADLLNEFWTTLRRSTPDPGARNSISPWMHSIITAVAWIVYIPLCAVYIPYLVLQHLVTKRPFASWTLDRRIKTRLQRLWACFFVPFANPLQTDPFDRPKTVGDVWEKAEKDEKVDVTPVWIPPVGDEFRFGVGYEPRVDAVNVPAYWIVPKWVRRDAGDAAGDGEKVILHIHGGGYLAGHPLWNRLALDCSQASNQRVLSINYRKPLTADNAFPGPLLDVLAGYVHLLSLGFKGKDITILGKSAGGHLSLLLSRYLSDLQLPLPGALTLFAPWSDFTFSFPSYDLHSPYDTISIDRLGMAVRSSMRYYRPEVLDSAYFSPAKAGSVVGRTGAWTYLAQAGCKVYAFVGSKERFYDEVKTLIQDMKCDGVAARLREDSEGLHTSALSVPTAFAVFLKDFCETVS